MINGFGSINGRFYQEFKKIIIRRKRLAISNNKIHFKDLYDLNVAFLNWRERI